MFNYIWPCEAFVYVSIKIYFPQNSKSVQLLMNASVNVNNITDDVNTKCYSSGIMNKLFNNFMYNDSK